LNTNQNPDGFARIPGTSGSPSVFLRYDLRVGACCAPRDREFRPGGRRPPRRTDPAEGAPMIKPFAAAVAAIATFASPAIAQTDDADAQQNAAQDDGTLSVGDQAPKFEGLKWLKGEPVESFKPGQVYVLDFWATWCGPCIAAMPHIIETQEKYRDDGVNVIGVSIWENGEPDEAMRGVERFIESRDDINYRMAYDYEGEAAQDFMRAAGRNGIPTVMIVDRQGVIAWMGHPMSMDDVLAAVVKGDFDPERFAAEQQRREARTQEVMQEINAAASQQDWDGMIAAMEELAELNDQFAGPVAMQIYTVLLTGKGDAEAAAAHGRKVVTGVFADQPQQLNQFAWSIAGPDAQIPREQQDLELALMAAERANKLTGGENADILDTLARVHYVRDDLDKAIETQQKAVDNASPALKSQLRERLEQYKAALGSS
jgi:thiol-disulfide isomerase/thioredoxin